MLLRLHSHTEHQGKEAVPSDCFLLADVGQPAFLLASFWGLAGFPSSFCIQDEWWCAAEGVRAATEPVPDTWGLPSLLRSSFLVHSFSDEPYKGKTSLASLPASFVQLSPFTWLQKPFCWNQGKVDLKSSNSVNELGSTRTRWVRTCFSWFGLVFFSPICEQGQCSWGILSTEEQSHNCCQHQAQFCLHAIPWGHFALPGKPHAHTDSRRDPCYVLCWPGLLTAIVTDMVPIKNLNEQQCRSSVSGKYSFQEIWQQGVLSPGRKF